MLGRTRNVAFLAVLAFVMAACPQRFQAAIDANPLACPEGSDCYDPPKPVGPGGTIVVEAGEFFFNVVEVNAAEGSVEVELRNGGGAEHNFRIDQAFGETKKVEATAGATSSGALELFPGELTFYCDIAGHREQGMEGTLVVRGADEAAPSPGASPSPTAEATP